jgi:triphosphatase
METEIKLNAIHLTDPLTVIRDPWVSALLMPESGQVIEMDSHYYDTAEATLGRLGYSLRLRHENDNRIVTVKAGGSAGDGLHQRMEWSVMLNGDETSWLDQMASGLAVDWFLRHAESDGDPDDLLYGTLQLIVGQPLLEICRVTFTRLAYDIGFGGTLMELALDTGELLSAGRSEPVCEFELELKEGDARDLKELGQELTERFGLLPDNLSKLARCMALSGKNHDD